MFANQYEEHLAHSAPCSSRWDGFDRGDSSSNNDSGSIVIGRMTARNGSRVEIVESWNQYDTCFDVLVDGCQVHFTFDRGDAVAVARQQFNA
jgi:hypothetical protein